jgi:deoxyguanosine kinase
MVVPILISIEGNIGSGKSTLLRELRERNPDWHFIDEPVESWMSLKNERGESLLQLFYGDKRRWAYTFQQTALLTRMAATKDAVAAWGAAGFHGSPIFITERCVETDAHVFAKMLAEEGDIDALEMTLYKKWFDRFADKTVRPAAYILVDTPVTVCHERIARRARSGEGGDAIPVEYLDRLDSAHFSWLMKDGQEVLRFDNTSKDGTRIQDVENWVKSQWLHALD